MDPMQIQNQQINGAVQQPQAPVQYVVQNAPQQQIPQQTVAPTVQQDGVFDKILKGIVDFIAKLAAPTPATTPVADQQPVQGTPVGQPQQPWQTIPWANFFNKIGNTLDAIGNQAEQMIQTGTSTVIQGTQNYVAQQPTAPIDTQQFLSQNYQQNTIPTQPIQQPVVPAQPVEQPVAPTVTPPTNQ